MGKNSKLIGYRKMAGLTQQDMANYLGINRATYFRKEQGKMAFTEKEILDVYKVLSKELRQTVPELKLSDIFFNNIGA